MVPQRALSSPVPVQIQHVPISALRRGSWRIEPQVFAPGELGWIAEQARRRVNLELGWPDTPAILRGPHLRDEAFHSLAAHPRLLARASAILSGPVELSGSALFVGDAIRLPGAFLPADVLFVIPLGAHASRGEIGYGVRVPEDIRHDWPFVVAMRRAASSDSATPPVGDDALWPCAASVAG